MTDTVLAPATAAPPGVVALRVRGLDVSYHGRAGDVAAVRDASLELNAGRCAAIVGESGSGKTTLAMAVAGFLDPTVATVQAAELTVAGVGTLTRPTARVLRNRVPGVSMIFQDAMTSLDPVWTVGSQLRAVLHRQPGLGRAAARAASRSWLQRVGLADTERILAARPGELSGGMRQRVMLALALCTEPTLLIADEPTSALDASLARSTMELMRELAAGCGTALLVITHDMHLCLRYADEVHVMAGGAIVESATPDQLRVKPAHPYTEGLLRCVPSLGNWDVSELPSLDRTAWAAR